MDLFEALYTTRAMRRITDEGVPVEVQRQLLDAAIRVPNAGNAQAWRFVLVDDPETRTRIATHYRATMDMYGRAYYGARTAAAVAAPDDPASQAHLRVMSSADYLAENFERYPLLLFAFSTDDIPSAGLALWNAMLAARAHGLGSCMTRMLCGSTATMEILGVPAEEGWQMAGCATFGYPTGRWGLAERLPAEDVTFHNSWGGPLPFRVGGPLHGAAAGKTVG